jgi:hypothetical protein
MIAPVPPPMAAPVNVRSCAPAAGMAMNVANASAVQSFFKLVPALATVIGLQQAGIIVANAGVIPATNRTQRNRCRAVLVSPATNPGANHETSCNGFAGSVGAWLGDGSLGPDGRLRTGESDRADTAAEIWGSSGGAAFECAHKRHRNLRPGKYQHRTRRHDAPASHRRDAAAGASAGTIRKRSRAAGRHAGLGSTPLRCRNSMPVAVFA